MSAENTHMNSLIRDKFARRRQPRDQQGRFAAEEHENSDVSKLLRIRELDAEAADYAGVAEMNRRLAAIDASIAPLRIAGIDAGAGLGQTHELHPDNMNARIRGSVRYQREQRAAYIREELLGG
jgi:hypothetical protein